MPRSLSVLIGVTSRSWGGNEKWALEAARALADRGHRAKVLWSHEPVLRQIEARGLPARRISLPGDLHPASFVSLVRVLRDERPDVLVLTKQREYWVGGLAARLAGLGAPARRTPGGGAASTGRPLVVLRLGLRRPLRGDLKRRLVFGRLADLVIVNSRAISDMLLATQWFDGGKVRLLLNGVDSAPGDRVRGRALLGSLGVPPDAPAVLAVGRLARMKGFDVLIRAFPRVLREFPAARLVILGDGGRRGELLDEAARAGVAGAVLLPGHRDDVRDALAGADVYALSSRNEGMANTLLEAMSVGAPIVATDVSGTTEAVRDGVDALVVPPDDEAALARAIVALLSDRSLARRLGDSAAARSRSLFTFERMASELEGIFLAALEAGPRVASGTRRRSNR